MLWPQKRLLVMVLSMLSLTLVGCVAAMPAPQPSYRYRLLDLEINATFAQPDANWDAYNLQGAQVALRDGAYRFEVGLQRYVYGLYRGQTFGNMVVQADVFNVSGHDAALYGLVCRAQSSGQGYYFLMEPGGNFSIQRMGRNQADPLVSWQAGSALNEGPRRNVLRAVCIEDYLAFYANGEFLAEVRDGRYDEGYAGVALALPPSTSEGLAQASFDDVQVWTAGL